MPAASPNGSEHPHSPTMREIAQKAGVHVTTVSLALRNSSQLPEATRTRIQELAQAMGYRPNPLVMALIQSRRSSRRVKFQGTLAFVIRSSFKENRVLKYYFQNLEVRANQLGFELTPFNLKEYGNKPEILQKVLLARNISGLIIGPLVEAAEELKFDWSRFASIALTFSLRIPEIDCVEFDFHEGMRLALKECEKRGYRRPGYISTMKTEVRTRDLVKGALFTYQENREGAVPPLIFEENGEGNPFEEWWLRWKPDVLISSRTVLIPCMRRLHRLKASIPRDVGLIDLNINNRASLHSGIYIGKDIQCPPAIDLLAGKLYRNEFGIPTYPQITLVPPVWHEGRTLPLRP